MAEAAREMTPEELFNKAMGHRRTMLSLNPKPGDDVPMLSLMADERAHRRADAKLDRLLDQAERISAVPPASSAAGTTGTSRAATSTGASSTCSASSPGGSACSSCGCSGCRGKG